MTPESYRRLFGSVPAGIHPKNNQHTDDRGMNPLNAFREFRDRLIRREGYVDGRAFSHMQRFRAHRADLNDQLNERFDHGDICGDNYSRAMFEAQQQDSSS